MHCPHDGSDLETCERYGLSLDRCPQCDGLWLDYAELDELEDTVFPEDEFKGTLIFSDAETALACPVCGQSLKAFQYRLHSLVVEHCPQMHGFWLDAGEEVRVRELLKERAKALAEKVRAEAEWGKLLRRLRSPSMAARLRDLPG